MLKADSDILFILYPLKSLCCNRKVPLHLNLWDVKRRGIMKFYTIKLPKVLGSLVRAMLGAFKKG